LLHDFGHDESPLCARRVTHPPQNLLKKFGNCSALADLDAFGVTLSEAKGLVLRTNEILRFAQNDRLSSYEVC
jgi:hypothetical protein